MRMVPVCDHVIAGHCRMSALHQAALSGNVDVMRLLLEHGAVVDIADSKSKSPSVSITAR